LDGRKGAAIEEDGHVMDGWIIDIPACRERLKDFLLFYDTTFLAIRFSGIIS
jgi:hypothetical protein